MTRALSLAAFACFVLVAPARAADLPYFAGGAGGWTLDSPPPLTVWDAPPPADPWTGLRVGTEVFAASGVGKGARGGFGGAGYIGYFKELDNRIVIGAQGEAGYLPGVSQYGPRGYSYGLAELKVGYDMGRMMPYVTVGVGLAKPSNSLYGSPTGLSALNDMFINSGQGTNTITTVGAGVDYAVTDHLTVSVGVNAVQQRGAGWGAPLVPQPGMP